MKKIHLLWIMPTTLILGLLIGFSSSIYIAVPEKITIEMGYTNQTLNWLNKCYNLTDYPEPEEINITIKEAQNIDKTIGLKTK